MHNLSPKQLLTLWSQLVDAFYGQNKYGGDTAEIYVYTIQPNNPLRYHMSLSKDEEIKTDAKQAAQDLVTLLHLFQEHYQCSIRVDGVPLKKKQKEVPLNTHRWHIQVVRTKK